MKNETKVMAMGTALQIVAARDQRMYRLRRASSSTRRFSFTLSAKRRSQAKYLIIRIFWRTSLVECILASVAAIMVFWARWNDLAMYKLRGKSRAIMTMPAKELSPRILYSRVIAIAIWTGVAAQRKCRYAQISATLKESIDIKLMIFPLLALTSTAFSVFA